ncbi:LON peptidase N-terminal domain and RING finger protein 3-like isoform X2 [Littorina saxatilis]|uniref:LON peptidase N-terminal domain and RING finger protein 3 n=1 Tax=Littorina saxatilis TaxID=31220 RepID=A0AAN9B176_9CAEN
MVDLARQAFSTNNFGLAAEIYERTIKENGPQADLYLGLADSFARGGQFTKAFDAYTNAFRLGRVTPEKLKHLVTALIESLSQDSSSSGGQQNSMKKSCMFTCVLCRGLLNDPVTIKCGHTFCRKCLERDRTKTCKVCGIVHYRLKPANIRTNVVLSNLIHKWFPDSCRAAELKAEGNKFFEKRDFERAIKFYSEAISLSDADHLLFSNRSHAYNALDQYDKALEDAEKVVKMRPDWPKGFFRKGLALYGLGRYEEAVIAFLQCLALDKEVTSAKEYLSKSLHMVLSQLPPDDPKALQRQREANPSLFQALVNSNFNISTFLPHITANTFNQLKQIMNDTVEEASNFMPPSQACSGASPVLDDAKDLLKVSPYLQEPGSMLEKHRCNSVPVLKETSPPGSPESVLRQRSRSQSPDRKDLETQGSRKRSRNPSVNQPLSPTHSSPQKCLRSEAEEKSGASDKKAISEDLLSVEDLECSLCYRLFYKPVTTPCGHSFCCECLDRCMDHQTSCPMCKSSLAEYLAERRSTMTECLQAIIVNYFEKEYIDRQKIHEEEINELAKMGLDTQHEIPVFVCTLGFPSVPCPLHIFEPRYRLMIRQCMESGTRQFGMCACLSDNEENFSDYGCMLEVRDVHFFADGRSLVDTVGGRRFRVLGRSKRDGYNTAKVEFLSDDPVDQAVLPELQQLQHDIYADMKKWLDRLPAVHKARISQHFGTIPTMDPNPSTNPNGPHWAWWCIAVLPIDTRVQLALLAMGSFKERLEAMKKVLQYLGKRHS